MFGKGRQMDFSGEFNNSIDPKGRVSIPAKFRDVLKDVYGDEQLVVAKNSEGGLTAYPASQWHKNVENLRNNVSGGAARATLRLVVASAVECTFDKQGRIQVPTSLRSYAALEKEIVVLGVFDKIEIYSHIQHSAVMNSARQILRENPDFLDEHGF